jgi:glycosyltransferase involved in cell wall biosynthesis
MKKTKLLCILHRSPPAHGAAKVGDFISESKKLQEAYECKFITIKSSDTIGDIGKVNFKKLYLVVELYIKVLFALIIFRPDKIYYTASVSGAAFYRDLLVSTLWKIYEKITTVDVYYHYHTKGIDKFVSSSSRNLKLTKFFLKNVNVVLLSPLLKKDIEQFSTYKKILYLPNGVEDQMKNEDFSKYVEAKYNENSTIHILYLAHMMKDKGYWEVLEMAQATPLNNVHYHFAGSWQKKSNEKEFFDFIKQHNLEKKIIYHGFVNGKEKDTLFRNTSMLVYPSKNDAFPLTLLESLSYGVPVLATNEGSIPYILDDRSGIVISDLVDLSNAFENMLSNFVNKETAKYCRERYLNNFSLEIFENNLVNIFK